MVSFSVLASPGHTHPSRKLSSSLEAHYMDHRDQSLNFPSKLGPRVSLLLLRGGWDHSSSCLVIRVGSWAMTHFLMHRVRTSSFGFPARGGLEAPAQREQHRAAHTGQGVWWLNQTCTPAGLWCGLRPDEL